MTTNSEIRVDNIQKVYGKRQVVKGISMNLKQGEIVGLLGPNGGEIYIDQTNVTKFPMFKRSRLGLAYLPQEASVFRKLTVEENIEAVMQLIKYPKA